MKINFLGTIFGASGYDMHCKGLVNAMYALNPDMALRTPAPPDWMKQTNDAEYKMMLTSFDRNAITVMVGLPHTWKLALNEGLKKFVGFVVWEGDRIPSFWAEHFRDARIKQIWVPSNHVRQAILNTTGDEFTGKLRVVPHGVDHSIFKRTIIERPEMFTFVANKGWAKGLNDRGGMQWVMKAFNQEFGKADNVRLIAKVNPVYCPQGWDINREMAKLNLEKDKCQIMINTSLMQQKDVAQLYSQGDVFVSATMGEAFNLPGIEAMACGLPTIQTGFGGQTDYMTDENGWTIDYSPIPVPQDVAFPDLTMYEEVKWAMPDIGHLRRIMRHCYENRNEVKIKGEKAFENSKDWTWQKSAEKAMKFLAEIE